MIAGAAEYTEGATSISGLETPLPNTLVIHLTKPAGDLGARLAMPAAAPLPPGAADGHESGYGRYLVASGPYMIEGAEQLRPDLPYDQQPAVSGYVAGERLTLVRNPSWDPATNSLHAALSDRIEFVQVGYEEQLEAILDNEIDLAINLDLELEDVERFRANSSLASRLHVSAGQASGWITLNLAVPPFDDLHVRRAIQFATNRSTLSSILIPGSAVQAHAIPDIFQNGLLADYDPYGALDHGGDPARATAEMAQSRYDADGDGVCDDPVCTAITLPVEDFPELRVAAEAFASQMSGVGLTFDIQPLAGQELFPMLQDPTSQTPIGFNIGWASDYLNAASWFGPMARSGSIGNEFG